MDTYNCRWQYTVENMKNGCIRFNYSCLGNWCTSLFVCIFQRSTESIHVNLVSVANVAVIIDASIEYLIRYASSVRQHDQIQQNQLVFFFSSCVTCHCHWTFDSWDVLIVSHFPYNFNMTNERQIKYAYRVQMSQ